MEFGGMHDIVDLIRKCSYKEDPGDIVITQFLDNAKVANINPMPYIDNDGIGHYDYGSEVGYDAGKDYLVLDGSATVTTMIGIETLLSATESPNLSKNPEDLKIAIDKFFLADDARADTEFILGTIIGNDGKPKLNENFSKLYDEQKMKLVVDDISVGESTDTNVYLNIVVSWK